MEEPLLQIKNLNISTSNQKLFKNFNLTLQEGECIGISAPTGKGKSSLLNFIAEVLNFQKGINYSGELYKQKDLKISYVFQQANLIENASVLENVLFPVENLMDKTAAKKIAENWINKLDLDQKIMEKVSVLSGGEKQRVSLARAFAYPSKVLLLDEPFSSQDDDIKEKIIQLVDFQIKHEKKAAIIISHNKNDLEKLCQKIIEATDFILN